MDKKFETRDKYNSKSLLFKVLNAVLWNVGIFLEEIVKFCKVIFVLLRFGGYQHSLAKALISKMRT